MKRAVFVMALLLCAAPLAAQERSVEFTLWGSMVEMQGDSTLADTFETDFDSGSGFGLSAGFFLTERFAVELAAFSLSADASFSHPDIGEFDMGEAELFPISLGVQFHFAGQGRFDPYVGAGAAYVLVDDFESDDLTNLGVGTVEADDEVTYYVNAGLGFMFTDGFGLALDARYIPFESTTTASVAPGEEDIEFTPLVYSAGLRFRF